MTSLDADFPAARPPHKVHPLFWSLKRELWEHRAVWAAPAAVAGLVLLGYILGSFGLPNQVRRAEQDLPNSLELPYAVAIGACFIAAALSGTSYCLSCLQGERRDRSILFWKSLPVSDRTTLLAKAAMTMLVQPVAVFAVVVGAHLAMLAWGTFVMLMTNNNPAALWLHGFPGYMWLSLTLGLPCLALWHAPVIAWLMLVSAWARRAAFLWAIIPPLMLAVLERMAFDTHHLADFLNTRLQGGLAHVATSGGKGDAPVRSLADLNVLGMFADPNLWIGLVLAALLFEGAVRMRRMREPN